jgi:hypothetical protein
MMSQMDEALFYSEATGEKRPSLDRGLLILACILLQKHNEPFGDILTCEGVIYRTPTN